MTSQRNNSVSKATDGDGHHFVIRFTPPKYLSSPPGEKRITAYLDIEQGGKTHRRLLSWNAEVSAKEAASIAVKVAVKLLSDDVLYEDEDVPPGAVGPEDVVVRHLLVTDADGFPLLIDPAEYEARKGKQADATGEGGRFTVHDPEGAGEAGGATGYDDELRFYFVHVIVTYDDKEHVQTVGCQSDKGPRDAARSAVEFVASVYNEEDAYPGGGEIPLGGIGIEDIEVHSVVVIDDEGENVVVDPDEYDARWIPDQGAP